MSHSRMVLTSGTQLGPYEVSGPSVARGQAAGADQGIVHRDMKEENLVVNRSGRVNLLEFGLAKRTQAAPTVTDSEPRTTHSDACTVVGTVGYMSPEQARGNPADAR